MEKSRERWAELALHPVRIRILRAVAGAELTTRDLVERLPDIPQATLYRHLAALVKAGLLEVVTERRIRGATERVYALPGHGATLDPAALATATPEEHARYFTAFVSSLLSEFSRYLARERIDFVADGVGYHQLVLHLTDAELGEFATGFNAIVGPLLGNEPGNGRTPRLLATILMPADQPTPTGDKQTPEPAGDTGPTRGE
ncbi:Helix-turn-helix domain-containing protein [Micromonospora phaseoli]|uniref:Helix-turn-helix domain-containing protein n=1 Tax=Micromonospora phaseoli TaxID=1144548 RepID=A0A1H6UDG8_9ACTN|nr:helix-turn-helix domain-containing protein [Micromonospora phaseoli]PZV98889.1 helix-turn-helix protein [Micromonospora phaseoli]GIJ76360.1 transcriptional regulator [Micromonospora phaseoli]SEI87697.1 Helix-turn-helix domain-containing protein [Micromonospora phaseoli]